MKNTHTLKKEKRIHVLSVTLLHPRQRRTLFGNIFAPPN